MKSESLLCVAIIGAVFCCGAVFAQGPSDDPFGGGFSVNYKAEVLTMGTQNDSLHSWAFGWLSGEDSLVLIGDGSFPESYQCGEIRDIAVGDFDGDYGDELAVVWNRDDGGVFVGIPTIDPATLAPDPAGWHLPDVPISSGVLYATPVLADVLGEIRVVAGNFYPDHAVEFALAYLAADSTVTLTVFDVDSLTSIPAQMAAISDQAVNTDLPALQQFGAVSRFDIATGDFDGDGLDEVALVVNDPAQSPATNLVLKIYDCDTLSHALLPKPAISFTANSDGNHTCLRSVLMETGNFEPDSLDEIAILDSWSRADVDSSRVGTLHTVKLTTAMTGIAPSQTQSLPYCSWQNDAGLIGPNGPVHIMTIYNGELIVGGAFTAVGGFAANHIASWDGAHWKPLGAGVNDTVEALEVYEGDLIVGGYFTEAGGVPANHLARWDGSSWEEFGGGANNTVFDLLAPDSVSAGSLFACGDFTEVNGVSGYNRIARWDGSAWHTLGGGGLNGRGFEMMELLGHGPTCIVVTGAFSTFIVYWIPTNPNVWNFYVALNNWGHALAHAPDSALIVGGGFTSPQDYLAWWNSSSWADLGGNLNDRVNDLLFDDNTNNLYIGGRFTDAGDKSASRIARWHWPNTHSNDWAALGSGVTAATGTAEVVDMCFYGGELIAGGWFDHAGGISTSNIARWNQSLSQWHALSDSLQPMFSIGLAVGRFDADSKLDDIAITACGSDLGNVRQYLRVYGVDTLAPSLTLFEKGETNISGYWSDRELARSRRLIAVDDVTGDGQADLAVLSSEFPNRIEIYEPCDAMNNCTFDPMPQAGAWISGADNLTQLVLADLDTLTVTVGPPMAYHVDSVVQPLALIYAPPVHYDILDDTTWDISKRYVSPPAGPEYDTYVLYANTSGWESTMETTLRRDWGISASLEAWINVGGTGVDGYLESEYGQNFDSQQTYSVKITVGQIIEARDDDQICLVAVNYDVLEYPVLHSGELVGHILVVTPSQPFQEWKKAKDCGFLLPNHEVENILSYPSFADILANPSMASDAIGDLTAFTMQSLSSSQWYLGHQTFTNSSVTTSWDLSTAAGLNRTVGVEFETTAEVSVEYLGVGASVGTSTTFSAGVTAGLAGYYNQGQISSFSTSFSQTDSLHLTMGRINTAGDESGNRRYQLTPYAYWAKNGALVIDYAVRPNTDPVEPTWWQDHYGDPDPAFILPSRFVNEKEGTSEPEESRHKTKEVFFFPDNPEPGDSMVIGARVHNFSLVDILDPVAVSFYLGNPDNGGVILTDKNSGETVFYTRDTTGALVGVDAQSYAFVTMMWQVPIGEEITSCQRIWAVIDPLDEISPEVHDNGDWATNNKGWNLLRVNTTNYCYDPDEDGWVASAYRCCNTMSQWDNCPDIYNPDQTDTDGDGIGNACEDAVCGDANGDLSANVGDAVFLISYIFKGGAAPNPLCAGDANGDGSTNVGDAVYMISYVFKGGAAPVLTCCP